MRRIYLYLPILAMLMVAVVLGFYVYHFGSMKISGNPDHWGTFGDYVGGVLNPIFSFIGLGAVLLTFRLQMKELAKASEHAQKSADAALLSAEVSSSSLVVSNRAYITFLGEGLTSHANENSGEIFWRVFVKWVNRGNSPAMKCRIAVKWILSESRIETPENLDWSDISDRPFLSIGPSVDIITDINFFSAEQLSFVRERKKFLYIWGWCNYHDGFNGTPQRRTQFSLVSTGVTGDPKVAWNSSLPLNLHLMHFGSANLLDEDCYAFGYSPTV